MPSSRITIINIGIVLSMCTFLLMTSCKKDVTVIDDFSDIYTLPLIPFNYSNVEFPSLVNDYVMTFDNTPDNNPITDHGATLGRVLFYDVALSINGTIACASCHKQTLGFADNSPKSKGFDGGLTGRNSIGFANARFYSGVKFFWDHRAATLEDQVLMPFQDPVEMGLTLEGLVNKVTALDYYKPLFKNAFETEEVSSDKIAKALAQFIRSIYSFNTEYDIGIEATRNIFLDFPNFNELENIGKDIFNGKLTPEALGTCVTCHLPNTNALRFTNEIPSDANQVILSSGETSNIGLDESIDVDDNGEGAFYNSQGLYGFFKAPSLRNIELTGPYMHDGRFETLEEVVEHYSTGVKNHPTLSAHMKGGGGVPRNLNLTDLEARALVAFMKTMTDYELINDVKYSDPFVK